MKVPDVLFYENAQVTLSMLLVHTLINDTVSWFSRVCHFDASTLCPGIK